MFKYILTTLLTLGLFAGIASSYTLKRGPGNTQGNITYINNYADWQNFWYVAKRDDTPGSANEATKTTLVLTRDLIKNTISEPDGAVCNDDTNCGVFHAEPGCSGDAGSGVTNCYGGGGATDWAAQNVTIDCQGNAFIYDTVAGGGGTGDLPTSAKYGILRIDTAHFATGGAHGQSPLDFEVKNCHFINKNASTRQSAILVDTLDLFTILTFRNIEDSEVFAEDSLGTEAMANNTRSIKIAGSSGPTLTRVFDSFLSRGYGHNYGFQNYNWLVRDTVLCGATYGDNAGVGIYWDSSGQTWPGQVNTVGTQYYGCGGHAVYLRHTHLKESKAIYDDINLAGSANPSARKVGPYFVIGDDVGVDDAGFSPPRLSSHHSINAEFTLGANSYNSARVLYGIAATSGITLEGSINSQWGTAATCAVFEHGAAFKESYLSTTGAIFDVSHATDTDVEIRGPLNIKLKSNVVSTAGEICAPAAGVPANFMTDEMEDACAIGVNGCSGIIDLPGVGKWQILNSGYQMLPGMFQWTATDGNNDNGVDFCNLGLDNTTVSTTDGGVSGGLTCNTEFGVRNITDGTQGLCGDTETGDILVAYCE